jgi:hypothetical protein
MVKVRMNGIILVPKSCFNGEEFYGMERYIDNCEKGDGKHEMAKRRNVCRG